jgi:hypothetical protein
MAKRLALAVGLAAFVLMSGVPVFAQGNSPEVTKCRATKSKCACKKVCARFKAIIANEKKPDPARLAASNSKLESQYTKCMDKADAKGGCPAGASTATLEGKIDAFVADYLDEVGTGSPSGAFIQ